MQNIIWVATLVYERSEAYTGNARESKLPGSIFADPAY